MLQGHGERRSDEWSRRECQVPEVRFPGPLLIAGLLGS